MAGRSSIERDPALQAAVDALLKRNSTIDEIVAQVQAMGKDVSRSAVGRYSKQFAAIAAEQRKLTAFADQFSSEFADPGNIQGRLLIQLLTSITTRAIIPMAEGDGEFELDGKELHFLARAVKDITSASKTDVDREAKIREEAIKRAKEKAAVAGADAARAGGASEETIKRVRASILGIDA